MLSKNDIKLIKSLEHKKYRDKEGLFVAEGRKVVSELQKSFEMVAMYDDPADVCRLSFLRHPQDVLAVFRIRKSASDVRPIHDASLAHRLLYIALDRVQDPGNLGTIIRVADWFGVDTILCSEDTADVWNPKVVQATMGSLARVEVRYVDLLSAIQEYEGPVYGTFLDGDNIYDTELSSNGIIVFGNEGNGISPELREAISRRLLIPATREGAESLNVAVATAITLAEFRRR